MSVRLFGRRLAALLRARRLERELEDEMRAHLELAERDALAEGLNPAEARRVARLRFGSIEAIREEHRDRRSVRWIETFFKDLRYGLVLLRRDPGFALVAAGVMAIGIGATTAMFSFVDGVLLRPLPYPEPERLMRVLEAPTPAERNGISTLNFVDWKRLSSSFASLSAIRGFSGALTGDGEPSRVNGMLVSADYFDVFGVKAAAGRTFVAADERPGADHVVVISHAAWVGRFGADSQILNRKIVLDGEPHEVIGILPPGSFDRGDVTVWKPLVFGPDQMTRGYHWLGAVGRLRSGVTIDRAREEMKAVSASLAPLQPPFKRNWGVGIDPYDAGLVSDALRRSIVVAFGAVVLVLLIASANIANLLLAKGVTRRREMAVRAALGASRGRLISQVLTESLVLCLAGGAAGVGVAHLLTRVGVPLLTSSVPSTASIDIDGRVLGFALLATVGVSLLVGLLPALQLSSGRLAQAMNLAGRGISSRDGLRRVIVVVEVAVSLVLICGAALMFESLVKLRRVDAGVRIENVITMSADLPMSAYPDAERAWRFIEQVGERLRAVPGIEAAAVSTDVPLLGVRQGDAVGIPGLEANVGSRFKRVDPEYFPTLDIPLVAGRNFTAQDRPGAPRVAIVNEALAQQLAGQFKVADRAAVIGRIVRLNWPLYENRGQTGKPEDVQIVGLIRNERIADLAQPVANVVYVPLLQAPRREIKMLVRTAGDPASAMPAIRQAIAELDPRLPLGDVRTMAQVKQLTLSDETEPAVAIGAFAAVAALLAALGLYGVLANTVNQRRREIGIRMALGATAPDVVGHVLRNAALLVGVGLVLGLAGALALTRVTKTLLFEVSPLDPGAFAIAATAMAVIGLVAAVVPAARASRVDPVTALRID